MKITVTVDLNDFTKFLEKEDALEAYKEQVTFRIEEGRLVEFFNLTSPENLISGTFIWEGTPQGDDYWRKLNEKWEQMLVPKGWQLLTVEFRMNKVTGEDVRKYVYVPLTGKHLVMRDWSWSRKATKKSENSQWEFDPDKEAMIPASGRTSKKYLILSEKPEKKIMIDDKGCEIVRSLVKVWMPEINEVVWAMYGRFNSVED